MDALTEAIARAARRMPTAHLGGLAAFLAGQSDGPTAAAREQAKALFPVPSFRGSVDALWQAWRADPEVSGAAIALALRAAGAGVAADRAAERVEPVVTGPGTWLVPVRRTSDVLLEVIGAAASRLFLLSFATYRVPAVQAALVAALDRGVAVSMLMEDEELGDLQAANAYADLAPRATMLRWPAHERGAVGAGGLVPKMHAKAAIADGAAAFITSANLTGAGLEHNMELGVLVRGGPLPEKLERHFQQLVAAGVLVVAG